MSSDANGLKAPDIRALVGSGFTVLQGRTRTNNFECDCDRFDLFGNRVRYLVVLARVPATIRFNPRHIVELKLAIKSASE